jgi:hypothetical protein
MSFSLYSYLKENPQLNGPKVNYNWTAILTDPTVPASVKTELNELIGHKFVTLTDAVLFWSGHVQLSRMLDEGKYITKRSGKREWCKHQYLVYPDAFASQFALMVYSYVQLESKDAAFYTQYVYNTIFAIDNNRELFCSFDNWTIDKVHKLLTNRHKTSDRFAYSYFGNDYLSDQYCFELYSWIDEAFMARINHEQIQQVRQLILDCDKPGVKFKSINEVERAHDARTERTVAKLVENGGTKLEYHPDLIAVAEKFGFTLPDSDIAMIRRGKQHNNCVATYFAAHTSMVNAFIEPGETREVRRIFFTKDATLELSIEFCADGIVSTLMRQYKGRFNKDFKCDKALIAFRITLVGMPAEVLVVRRVSK